MKNVRNCNLLIVAVLDCINSYNIHMNTKIWSFRKSLKCTLIENASLKSFITEAKLIAPVHKKDHE